MPVWHEKTRPWVAERRLVVLGVVQEQHPARARLFAQWQGFDWPILHDPINALRAAAVPILVAIDEHGIVRSTRPRLETFEAEFLDREFADDAPGGDGSRLTVPANLALLQGVVEASPTAANLRQLGDGLALWGGEEKLDAAIDAYRWALEKDETDADARFRLGVCLRRRHESPARKAGDFQAAVAAWEAALARRPNQYIWRRRIQQYGPRLTKPYPFYDWVERARQEIVARGKEPVALPVGLTGSERAGPSRGFAEAAAAEPPDPEGKITRDDGLIDAQVTLVPSRVRPGATARVHVTLVPSARRRAHWNNEAEPLRLWIEPPEGCGVDQRLLSAPQGGRPETTETRRLDFEVQIPRDAAGTLRLSAYALYNVCEDAGGTCRYLRQDVAIEVPVAE